MTVTRVRTRTWVGQAVQRVEDERLLKGQGEYIADLRREGMLHAVVLRSPVAHGMLSAIDYQKAKAMAGVRAILTAADVERAFGRLPKIPMRQDAVDSVIPFMQPVMAKNKVRYVGEPIAVIVADTRAQAEDAMEAIALDIEALPTVANTDEAERGTVRLFDDQPANCALVITGVRGDIEAAFANAPYRRRERFKVHRHTAVPMETRGSLAEWDREKKRLTVWGATKAPFLCRRILAPLLGMAEADISMVEGDTGGSFGVRGEFYPDDFLIPFAARELGRPVRWIETRSEHFISCNHSRQADCEIEIACERDGTIRGMRARARTDMGAYVRTNGPTDDPADGRDERMRQRRLRERARALPRRFSLGGESEAERPAHRRPLPRQRDRLLHRGRRVRPARRGAPRAQFRRNLQRLYGLVGQRPGTGDCVLADRRRCARRADGPHPRRVPRLDRIREGRLRRVCLA
jgi:carbon-monoxide dehydrogenase large subunit